MTEPNRSCLQIELIPLIIIIHMKKLSASDWLKTDVFFMQYECKLQEEASYSYFSSCSAAHYFTIFQKVPYSRDTCCLSGVLSSTKRYSLRSKITVISRMFSSCYKQKRVD